MLKNLFSFITILILLVFTTSQALCSPTNIEIADKYLIWDITIQDTIDWKELNTKLNTKKYKITINQIKSVSENTYDIRFTYNNHTKSYKLYNSVSIYKIWLYNDELILFLKSGSGGYSSLFSAFLSNNEIILKDHKMVVPPLLNYNPDHDWLTFDGTNMLRKFPIYGAKDPNCCPTGGKGYILYEFNNHELKVKNFGITPNI